MTPDDLRTMVLAAEGLELEDGLRIGFDANVDIAGEGWERPKEVQALIDLAPKLATSLADAMERIEQLERDVEEWKVEADRSKWPKETAQEYYALRAMLPPEIGEDTYLGMPKQLQALYEAIHEDEEPTLERCFRRRGSDG